MRLIAPTEVTNLVDGKHRGAWVTTELQFVTSPLNECLDVLTHARANANLSLSHAELGVSLEVVIQFFERHIFTLSEKVVKDIIGDTLGCSLTLEESDIVNATGDQRVN